MTFTCSMFSAMEISFHSAFKAANVISSFVIFLAGLHSELTTQAQVTRLRTNRKMDNKSAHATPRKPSDLVGVPRGAHGLGRYPKNLLATRTGQPFL
jgi:hypothetical protein